MNRARFAIVVLALLLVTVPLFGASPFDVEPCSRAELQQEMDIKLARVIDFLKSEKLGGVLLTRIQNVSWITAGIADTHLTITSDVGPASVLITREGGRFVLGDVADIRRLTREDLAGLGFEARPCTEEQRAAVLRDLAGGLPLGSDVPVDGLRTVDGAFARLRYSLTDSELKKYRIVGSETAEGLEDSCRRITPGMSEREIEALVSDGLMRHGVRPTVLMVRVEERAADLRHAVPGNARLKTYVVVTASGRRWGLIASATRAVHFGPLPVEIDRRVRAAAYIQAHLQDDTRVGMGTVLLIQRLVGYFSDVGFGSEWDAEDMGGATGYKERDWVLRQGVAETIVDRQAMVWNASVLNARTEDTYIAFRDHFENLTLTNTWPTIVTVLNGHTYHSPNVLVVVPQRPTPTPIVTPSVVPTVTPRPTPSPTRAPTPTPTPARRETPTPRVTPTPAPHESAAPRVTPTPAPHESTTPRVTPTPAPHESAAPRVTPTPAPHESAAPRVTPTPAPHESAAPRVTPTPAPHESAAPRVTPTPAPHETATPLPTPSGTATPAPKETGTPSPTLAADLHVVALVPPSQKSGVTIVVPAAWTARLVSAGSVTAPTVWALDTATRRAIAMVYLYRASDGEPAAMRHDIERAASERQPAERRPQLGALERNQIAGRTIVWFAATKDGATTFVGSVQVGSTAVLLQYAGNPIEGLDILRGVQRQ